MAFAPMAVVDADREAPALPSQMFWAADGLVMVGQVEQAFCCTVVVTVQGAPLTSVTVMV